jgi:hypothetical protein
MRLFVFVRCARFLCFAAALVVAAATFDQALAAEEAAPSKYRVLLLGDSISMGYTPFVKEMLKDEAVVVRAMREDGRVENCAGTTHGVGRIEAWLALEGGEWDVIHFNFGLHDLKAVDPATGKASPNPEHPRQADLPTYRKQLAEIVKKLKQSEATLVFATTTPVPSKTVKPFRDPEDVIRYNTAAKEIMAAEGVVVDDSAPSNLNCNT